MERDDVLEENGFCNVRDAVISTKKNVSLQFIQLVVKKLIYYGI